MSLFRVSLFTASLLTASLLSACGPSRPPIPPGEVPQAKPVSVTDEQYGHQVFQELTDKYELDYNHPRTAEVQRIVERLTNAIGAGQQPWHVYVFRDPKFMNAAATRGNHVFVWTGMLDATKNEAELATILAHEISHVLAGHTEPDPNEEVKKMLISVGAAVAGIAVSAVTRSTYGNVGDLVSGMTNEVGQGLFVYPYSRDKELEADQVGLFLMARAHYDPRSAIEFWQRASGDPNFSQGLDFLSTHPPAGDRLKRLTELLPLALAVEQGRPMPRELPPHAPNAKDATNGAGPQSLANGTPPPAAPPSGRGQDASGGQPGTSAPLPGNDTFAIDTVPPQTSVSAGGAVLPVSGDGATKKNTWVVTSERALLYSRPNRRSKPRGEFRRGAEVEVVRRENSWLEIVSPDSGFLAADNLTPK